MKIVSMLCLAGVLAYTAYLAVLYFGQDGMVFPIRPADTAREKAITQYYKALQTLTIKTPDGTVLRGYLLPRARQGRPAPAVLYFCGNAEEQSAFFLWTPSELAGYTLAGVDYRGYGRSQGKPSEQALRADALTVYDALAAKLGPGVPIVVMGRSLGSGLAAHVAANRPVAGVILVTPYDSLAAVGRDAHPLVPVGWLLRHPFDVAPDAARVHAPTLMLVAGADTLIPPRHATRLAALWAGPKEVRTIEGASHNSIQDSPMYWELIRQFLGGLFPEPSREPAPPGPKPAS
jgi:pimeloyl-ACP methyl ester carboxylesterase